MGETNRGILVCNPNPQIEQQPQQSSSKFCDECKTNEFKYRCPGCTLRSCSLDCVKAHKQRTGCTGKRQQQTEFVPLSKFDDNILLSDYNMLEDVKRIADSAKRRRVQLCGNFFGVGIPHNLRILQKAAGNRRIRLLVLPSGMYKRETNQTSFNRKRKTISWTIECCFHSTNVKLIDHGVHESSNLYSVIQKHLKPGPLNHPLKPFCVEPVESLKCYISKHPKQPRSPFRELDMHAPICEQLTNLVIIEFPVIHVLLPSHSVDFEVVKDIVARPLQPKTGPVDDIQPSPKGVVFREEEFKDNGSADLLVMDLLNKPYSKTEAKEEGVIHNSVDSANHNNEHDVDLLNFDFDPELINTTTTTTLPNPAELINVYSNLMSEVKPDDFLDFDGLCDDLPPKEENFECGVIEEELEEGEIADSD